MIIQQVHCDVCKEPCNSWVFLASAHGLHDDGPKTFHVCGFSCLFSWINTWAYFLKNTEKLVIRRASLGDELAGTEPNGDA
jgi:hypothetical protein